MHIRNREETMLRREVEKASCRQRGFFGPIRGERSVGPRRASPEADRGMSERGST
jgi:hypothetical protein